MIPTLAYPNSVVMTIDGLDGSTLSAIADADVRPGVPTNFDYGRKLIVVKRVGGGPDEDDLTDYPILQVACYAPSYLAAAEMQQDVQRQILAWPLTAVGPDAILVDEAEIYVGEQEIPDIYPDERRVVATYRLGLRRQFRP
jgi:hypothetical protein